MQNRYTDNHSSKAEYAYTEHNKLFYKNVNDSIITDATMMRAVYRNVGLPGS